MENLVIPTQSSVDTSRPGRGSIVDETPTNYVVLDVETTGLDPAANAIIELAAVRVEFGQEVSHFSELMIPYKVIGVTPEAAQSLREGIDYFHEGDRLYRYVDDEVTKITGITNEMLIGKPTEEEIIRAFAEFLRPHDLIVAHNAAFDVNFLYDAYMRHLGRPLTNNYIDTMSVARRVLPHLERYRLLDLTEHYHVVNEGAHRALNDVRATQAVFELMKGDQSSTDSSTMSLF